MCLELRQFYVQPWICDARSTAHNEGYIQWNPSKPELLKTGILVKPDENFSPIFPHTNENNMENVGIARTSNAYIFHVIFQAMVS